MIASFQISNFIHKTNLCPERCHGFRSCHSTETLLISLNEQCRLALNQQKICYLLLFDFSKVFDLLDHDILIKKLHKYNFSKDALLWTISYLRNRSVCTNIKDENSEFIETKYGVPQGSVLGPLLFTIYTYDLNNTLSQGTVFQYADDTQILLALNKEDAHNAENIIAEAINIVQMWAKNNRLILNTEKTQVLHLTKRAQMTELTEAKNLGVIFDSKMNWQKYLQTVSKKVYKKNS